LNNRQIKRLLILQ